jgi:hypothetical protein
VAAKAQPVLTDPARGGCDNCGRDGRMLAARVEQKNGPAPSSTLPPQGPTQASAFRLSLRPFCPSNNRSERAIWADIAAALIRRARKLYVSDDIGLDLIDTVYALDSTTIDLCLLLFPWADFCSTKAAVKMHTPLGLRCEPRLYPHFGRQNGRCCSTRSDRAGRRSHLCDGSRLRRFS